MLPQGSQVSFTKYCQAATWASAPCGRGARNGRDSSGWRLGRTWQLGPVTDLIQDQDRRGHQGSPFTAHQTHPWGRRLAKARLGDGPDGGLAQWGPWQGGQGCRELEASPDCSHWGRGWCSQGLFVHSLNKITIGYPHDSNINRTITVLHNI